jgi:type I restriction enzyme S subunit
MDGDFHIRKWKGTPSLLNQRILKLYEGTRSNINLEFFYYLAQPFLLKVHKRTAGTTVKHLSTKDFRNAGFKIPKYQEQQKIAEILSTVDDKIEVIDQQITETQALKKGLMQRLLTKGIGHTEFKDSNLGMIPESWEVVELVSHIKLLSGFAFKSDGFNEEGKGIKLLRGINITIGKLRWNDKLDRWWDLPFEEIEKYSAKVGDLVISMDGSLVGRNYSRVQEEDLPLLIVQRVACIRAKSTLDLEFLNQIIGSPLWLNYVDAVKTSSGIPHISAKNIREFKIPFPPITEQKQVASILSTVDNKLEVLLEKKTHYQKLKQGLMQKLLTGKVRVKV